MLYLELTLNKFIIIIIIINCYYYSLRKFIPVLPIDSFFQFFLWNSCYDTVFSPLKRNRPFPTNTFWLPHNDFALRSAVAYGTCFETYIMSTQHLRFFNHWKTLGDFIYQRNDCYWHVKLVIDFSTFAFLTVVNIQQKSIGSYILADIILTINESLRYASARFGFLKLPVRVSLTNDSKQSFYALID